MTTQTQQLTKVERAGQKALKIGAAVTAALCIIAGLAAGLLGVAIVLGLFLFVFLPIMFWIGMAEMARKKAAEKMRAKKLANMQATIMKQHRQ